ncbi:LysR family transcriptional regulator [Pseudomonas psychrotolerans L19]|nr:LysR family transcriptional regulator [Pseudomonas psychrotolerans L19]
MNRNDLRRIDLHLLVVFESLMHERNLTRTAEKLFLGQPAISAALVRLRQFFDDPLLVRSGRAMEPTPRALAILERLRPALDGLSNALSEVDDCQSRGVSPGHVRRRRMRPAAAAAGPSARGGAALRAGGAQRQLPALARAAGQWRGLPGHQLHHPAAGQRQVPYPEAHPRPGSARRPRSRPPDPGRLLRPAPCAGVHVWRSLRQHRRRPGAPRPQSQGGPGRTPLQRPRRPAGRQRIARHRARLRRPGAGRGRQSAHRGTAVSHRPGQAVAGLARGPGPGSGRALAARRDHQIHGREPLAPRLSALSISAIRRYDLWRRGLAF